MSSSGLGGAEFLKSVFESSPDAIFVLDDDGYVVYVNQQACATLGYERDELVGIHLLAVADTPGTHLFEHPPDEIDPDEVITIEGTHTRKDGLRFPVQVRMTTIEGVGETQFLAIARDISDTKARHRELERKNARLDEFASVVSHDMKNPLSVARGHLELAREDVESDHLAVVAGSLDRMEELLDSVLTLARDGRTIGSVEPIDLDDLVSRSARTLVSPPSTIDIDTNAIVSGDPNRLSEVFENLIENAIDHGGPAVAIRVGLLDDGVFLEDDGRGIDVADDARLFEIGYSTADDGTGFGLGIVRDIVEAHGWTITVTESASGGAKFEIRGVDLEDRE